MGVLEVFDQFPVAHADRAARGGFSDIAREVPEDGVAVDGHGHRLAHADICQRVLAIHIVGLKIVGALVHAEEEI